MMGFGFLGLLLLLIFAGVFVAGIPALAKYFSSNSWSQSSQPDDQPSAKEILDQRYARGEISQEEYQGAKKDLGE